MAVGVTVGCGDAPGEADGAGVKDGAEEPIGDADGEPVGVGAGVTLTEGVDDVVAEGVGEAEGISTVAEDISVEDCVFTLNERSSEHPRSNPTERQNVKLKTRYMIPAFGDATSCSRVTRAARFWPHKFESQMQFCNLLNLPGFFTIETFAFLLMFDLDTLGAFTDSARPQGRSAKKFADADLLGATAGIKGERHRFGERNNRSRLSLVPQHSGELL